MCRGRMVMMAWVNGGDDSDCGDEGSGESGESVVV